MSKIMKQLGNKKLDTKAATEALKKMDEAAAKATEAVKVAPMPAPHVATISPDSIPVVHYPDFIPIICKPKSQMKDSERKELIQRIKAMSREELELVSELIPVDLCLRRIDGELQKAKRFEESIKSTMNILEE